ncbi:MAG: hypothetical protein IPM23_07825 [Candidatus Melainabacteria bacterium]|nr:hypothetical protein [Candidatus Melainabacteria bacterium]
MRAAPSTTGGNYCPACGLETQSKIEFCPHDRTRTVSSPAQGEIIRRNIVAVYDFGVSAERNPYKLPRLTTLTIESCPEVSKEVLTALKARKGEFFLIKDMDQGSAWLLSFAWFYRHGTQF